MTIELPGYSVTVKSNFQWDMTAHSIWNADPQIGQTLPTSLLAACLQRLQKAGGHINAVDRYLWVDKERGMWSGNQAKARIVEVLQMLRDSPDPFGGNDPFPEVERYLPHEVLHTLLSEFDALLPASQVVQELADAERDVLDKDFLQCGSRKLTAEEHEELTAGIARSRRYQEALHASLKLAEAAVTQRYLRLKPGDWLHLGRGEHVYALDIQGLTVQVFNSMDARQGCRASIARYDLIYSKARPADPLPGFLGPAYYAHSQARRELECIGRLLRENATPQALRDQMIRVLVSLARTWWLIHEPGHLGLVSDHPYLSLVKKLEGRAAPAIAAPLCGMANRVEEISGWKNPRLGVHPDDGWGLEFAVMAAALGKVVAALDKEMRLKWCQAEGKPEPGMPHLT